MVTQEFKYNGCKFRFLFDGSQIGSGVIINSHMLMTDKFFETLRHAHEVFRARLPYARYFEDNDRDGIEQAFRDPYTEFSQEYIQSVREYLEKSRLQSIAIGQNKKTSSKGVASNKRKHVLKRDNHTCQNPHCNFYDASGNDLHIDHITPVSRGGTNALTNLQVLCASCNLRKHDMTMTEFLEMEGSNDQSNL